LAAAQQVVLWWNWISHLRLTNSGVQALQEAMQSRDSAEAITHELEAAHANIARVVGCLESEHDRVKTFGSADSATQTWDMSTGTDTPIAAAAAGVEGPGLPQQLADAERRARVAQSQLYAARAQIAQLTDESTTLWQRLSTLAHDAELQRRALLERVHMLQQRLRRYESPSPMVPDVGLTPEARRVGSFESEKSTRSAALPMPTAADASPPSAGDGPARRSVSALPGRRSPTEPAVAAAAAESLSTVTMDTVSSRARRRLRRATLFSQSIVRLADHPEHAASTPIPLGQGLQSSPPRTQSAGLSPKVSSPKLLDSVVSSPPSSPGKDPRQAKVWRY
jgi:hypothetical protein